MRGAAAPHHDVALWPRRALLQQAGVPALAAHHILGENEYACDRCSTRLRAARELRVHLFLGCRAPSAPLFLAALVQRLQPAPPPPPPAALEALAAAWGRGAGGAGGHACVYCGRLYSRRYGLKIHLRTHTGYKPLSCPHCRRAFGDPSNLNKHVKLHAGAGAGAGAARGAHGCGVCGKALVRRRDLERHMRARHAPVDDTPALTTLT